MKELLTPSRTFAAALLLGWGACATAQSLGTPVADVLLGQPLAMSVPARFASRDTADECVHADVFYGEKRVPDGHVRATVTGPDGQRRVRIESESPIDEPIVTVSLRAGCRNTITRNYTLLPEYPSETRLAALEARNLAAAPAAVPLRLASRAAPAAAPAPAPVVRRAPARPTVVAQAGEAKPQRPVRATRNSARRTAPAPHARLRLEPIDLEPQTMLRVTPSLAEPQGDAARRATAALLWQAINADPQELLRTSAMLEKLEADLAQMRKTNSQTRAELVALRQRLDRSEPWSGSARLLQFLALLVAAAAAAAGVLWWRTRQLPSATGPWYAGAAAAPDSAAEVAPQPMVEEVAPQPVAVPAPAFGAAAPVPATTVAAASLAPLQPAPGTIDFELPPAAARSRNAAEAALRVETLAATFEEVEFLSSLGLASDAMDVLKTYLQDSASPSPLAFFELMRLCDPVDDAAALAAARRRYGHTFGVEPPRLEQVTASLGLESLTPLSERVARAWACGEARALIEDTLFTVPTAAAPLTLQAGRDLLCLYQLAAALAQEGAAPADDAEGHPLAPWAHADDPTAAHLMAQAVADAQGGHHFALDVDLGAAPPALPEPVPLHEDVQPDLDPLLAVSLAAADRDRAARARAARRAAEEDAFSAAMASERIPVSRF
jgi:hypothetical protein